MRHRVISMIVVVSFAAVTTGGVARGAAVQPYGANDYGAGAGPGGGFHDVLPPGTNGLVTLPALGLYEADNAIKPAHNDDQIGMYSNLVYAAPSLTDADIPKYFKDSTFGVPDGDVDSQRTVTFDNPPVTIIRDKQFGVPHVYGATRHGTMFGAGYIAAEDRLFFMDVLRHTGRSQLSSFAGGSNIGMDESTFQLDPYTDQELTDQVTALPREYGAEGQQTEDDIDDYVAGINEYIDEAKMNPLKMPGEYAALGHIAGPDPWTPGDVASVADVIGGILGNGGGDQLTWAKILEAMQKRFGKSSGTRSYLDFRSPEDPEAPLTARSGHFPFMAPVKHPAKDAVALPDPGSVVTEPATTSGQTHPGTPLRSATRAGKGIFGASSIKQAFPQGLSNALLVSRKHTVSGHPIAVFGPQVGYFAPQVLMEEDLHGPGIDAAGAAVTGASLYVELGHGRDYAWSATSSGQGVTDVFAVPLCNTDGSAATVKSDAYVQGSKCTPMLTVTRSNSWSPNLADSAAAGSETLIAKRTAYGIVMARATVHGKPVAYTLQRPTFQHEVDSSIGFQEFNNPDVVHDVKSFQHAAYKIGYTFNWLYIDDRDIGYFDSGANPVRNRNTDGMLPAPVKYEWQGFNGADNTARTTPFKQHPQIINQSYITSWNNKQARGYRGVDGAYTPLYRSQLLDDRIKADLAHGHKMTLAQLVGAMEDAGTVDLRADKVLPWILRVIGTRPVTDPKLTDAIAELKEWVKDGSHRRDLAKTGTYPHSDAIRILDAWWPLLVKAEFEPTLGSAAYDLLVSHIAPDNDPNNGGAHLGSAYEHGWYGYVQKDLRDLVSAQRHIANRPVVKGRYSRVYCGRGSLAACRSMLLSTLTTAVGTSPQRLYGDVSCGKAGRSYDQECFDSVGFRAIGVVGQPLLPWINRPTFQQTVELTRHRPR